jgi:hypothetical protein
VVTVAILLGVLALGVAILALIYAVASWSEARSELRSIDSLANQLAAKASKASLNDLEARVMKVSSRRAEAKSGPRDADGLTTASFNEPEERLMLIAQEAREVADKAHGRLNEHIYDADAHPAARKKHEEACNKRSGMAMERANKALWRLDEYELESASLEVAVATERALRATSAKLKPRKSARKGVRK